jgi:replicative DNA helicase
MLNSLYRGWCKGHLLLRGAPSSMGKTTMGISDLCNVASLKVWDDDKNDFVFCSLNR